MIVVTGAWQRQGYTGWDHLLDDSPLESIIGRNFSSLAEARKAATRALRGTQDQRCDGAPIEIEYEVV